MVLPQKIPIIPQPVIATYDYVDIAEGTGIVTYYLASDQAASKMLGKNVLFSSDAEINLVISGGAPASVRATHTYDLPAFNLPKTVKGTAYLEIATGMDANAGAGRSGYIKATVQKVSTATTDVGTANTKDWGVNDGEQSYFTKISLAETHFKRGDILRLKLEVWGNVRTATGNTNFFFGQDPKNRDGTFLTPSTDADVSTISKLYVPFRIDIQ